jgi:hypothetical protein
VAKNSFTGHDFKSKRTDLEPVQVRIFARGGAHRLFYPFIVTMTSKVAGAEAAEAQQNLDRRAKIAAARLFRALESARHLVDVPRWSPSAPGRLIDKANR